MCCLLELVGCHPVLHTFLVDDVSWIKDMLNSGKEEVREFASVLYGILVAHVLDDNKFDSALKDLINATKNDKYLETQHGSLLGIANAMERRITIKKISYDNITDSEIYKTTVDVIGNVPETRSFRMLISYFFPQLTS